MQVTYEIYLITKEDRYRKFTFKLADWLVTKNVFNIINPKSNGMGVATWMEGFTDAFALAKLIKDTNRINKYRKAIKIGFKNIMLLQIKSNNKLTNFGFMQSEKTKILRVDWNQHALNAFLKIRKYSIF